LRIERGTLRDYATFAAMHYRQRDNLGFIDRVFVMREGSGGPAVGIVVYGRAALELNLRNRATGGRFVRNADLLNRELRVLKRLAIHPDLRGCGLGRHLVQRTLPYTGTRFVECLAAMGAVHPVFDQAGMRRIGVVQAPGSRDTAVRALTKMGVDPLDADFVKQVRRRPAVRRIVAGAVADWYRSTTGGGERRVARQSTTFLAQTFRQLAGSQPVYFLWAGDPEGWALIDRHHESRCASREMNN
jgi:GNAT superfamily N-acetyltransferase